MGESSNWGGNRDEKSTGPYPDMCTAPEPRRAGARLFRPAQRAEPDGERTGRRL